MSGFDTSVTHFSGIHSLHGGGIRDIESVMYRRLIAVRILIGVVPSLKIAQVPWLYRVMLSLRQRTWNSE